MIFGTYELHKSNKCCSAIIIIKRSLLDRHVYQHIWCRLIICNEIHDVVQKIFQNVCNNDFTAVIVSEMCSHCVYDSNGQHTVDDSVINEPLRQFQLIHGVELLVLQTCFCIASKWHSPPDLYLAIGEPQIRLIEGAFLMLQVGDSVLCSV